MYRILYIRIYHLHWHVFYPKSALWIYNSHFHHKYRSEIPFYRPVDSSLQITISTDEILKNRFLMQTQSYHNCSDLHLTVLLHQSNLPDTLLLCFLLFFCISMMHRCIYDCFSHIYPFCQFNNKIIPSFVSL